MDSFDPAADFLLHQPSYESLFEAANSRMGEELDYRCKGCRQIVKRWRRLDHWQTHRTLQARQDEARKVELAAERKANLARARQLRKENKAA
jgi:hypothetical protein